MAQKTIGKGEVCCKTALNFRKKPDIDAEKLPEGPILKGEVVDIVSKRGAWYRIKYQDKYGYAMAEFIDIIKEENN